MIAAIYPFIWKGVASLWVVIRYLSSMGCFPVAHPFMAPIYPSNCPSSVIAIHGRPFMWEGDGHPFI